MQVIASIKKQEFFDKIRSDFFSYSIFQYKIIYSFLSLYKPNINTYEKRFCNFTETFYSYNTILNLASEAAALFLAPPRRKY